ncbi:MarR family transcriptional regulator [Natrinema sp. CBA1119]|jgi:transcription initiation factor IIE alpha subunit|uniref:MarR family transcriptional regulator n=1 Tax=unclassified Natrinema TaxID=2622230 RepID=UPI000BF934F2|nr:helix-turn-helix domain-containing protein [Natrinema sp. CBA1119]PGF17300.1 MarR family transcriptional regulator [Natrinema sp. CBA1119]
MSATESDSELDEATDETKETSEDERSDESEETAAESAISEFPPSAKLVYKVLEYEGPLTQERIAAESRLCPRTVRYALGKLEDGGLVTSRVCLEDARQSKYRIGE